MPDDAPRTDNPVSISVRPAGPDDRDALESLIGDCYGAVYPGWYDEDTLSDALPAMLRIDPALLESGRYFAAHIGGRLAGCGGWSLATPGSGALEQATGHIRHFATDPALMRSGVGSAIIDRCMHEARQAGVKTLKCFSSLAAEQFYARHGFERIDAVNIMLGDGIPFPAVLMEKKLV